MHITDVFYPKHRAEWRQWLQEHHRAKSEIWLQTFRKTSGKPSIAYEEVVEESLCFGWIDGTVKQYDGDSSVQRITPRRKNSSLSELNRQRVWKLQRLGLMTPAGIAPIANQIGHPDDPFDFPIWIQEKLQADPEVWKIFEAFPHFYRRLKIGWIADIKGISRRAEAEKRLDFLIKMTAQGKMYGAQPLKGFELRDGVS
jgi:uncharacterized protein YdeI (YjbR/CyaY-like superfamily)